MKKYEYNYFDLPKMIELERVRDKEKALISGGDIFIEILNKLGSEGWDLVPQGDIAYFGKREVNA